MSIASHLWPVNELQFPARTGRRYSVRIVILTCLCQFAIATYGQASDSAEVVLEASRAIPNGGKYNSRWTGSGTPREIRFRGQRILSKGKDGTYCSGFTFAVVMDSSERLGLLKDVTVKDVRRFQQSWYGATSASREKQCVVAAETLKIGKAVPEEKAAAGDFIQFWRKKNGHSAILLGWIKDGSQRIGFKYRSSQSSTRGVGDRTEYFSDAPGLKGTVDRKRTWYLRLNNAQ